LMHSHPPTARVSLSHRQSSGTRPRPSHHRFHAPNRCGRRAMDWHQMARWEHVHVESVPIQSSDVVVTSADHAGGAGAGGTTCPDVAHYTNCDLQLGDTTTRALVAAIARGVDLWQLQHGGADSSGDAARAHSGQARRQARQAGGHTLKRALKRLFRRN
jgi:hypothetical protein